MSSTPRIRTAARALVMDREHRVLLVHFDFLDHLGGLWACPGGGVEQGESLTSGIVRELLEETGLQIDEPGDPIWTKQHLFPMTNWDGQHDTYFFVEVDTFEPRPQFSEAELRAEHVDGLRWWGYDELLAAQAVYDADDTTNPAYAVFSPRNIGHLVTQLLAEGPPQTPIDVSVNSGQPSD